MAVTARQLGADILDKVTEEGAFANLALAASLRDVNPRDRGFITHLVYGTLRHLMPIDYQLEHFLRKPLKTKDRYLKAILRQGFFEVLYTDTAPHAVVDEAVRLAKKRGHEGWGKITNGVLRTLMRQRDSLIWPRFEETWQDAAFQQSIPAWIGELWCRERGEKEAESLLRSLATPAPLVLRVNTLKANANTVLASLKELGFEAAKGRYGPDALIVHNANGLLETDLFRDGYILIQEEAAQLPAVVLAPREGERILDMCAAPGGKATYLAQWRGDKGTVVAADMYDHKLDLIRANAMRLGLESIEVVKRDGCSWGEDSPLTFDGILLDAPCSGLGTLGHRIDARLKKRVEDIDALCDIQRQLLSSAAKALKPGGRLIYATCTISERENEGNRRWFLEQHPEFSPLPFGTAVDWDEDDRAQANDGSIQMLMTKHGTDGFYIAAFRKV